MKIVIITVMKMSIKLIKLMKNLKQYFQFIIAIFAENGHENVDENAIKEG